VIEKSLLLPCGPARAFRLITEEAGAWWPPERLPELKIELKEMGWNVRT